MNETTASFAERRIGSLKNVFYRYREVYENKYFLKLAPFVTTLNCRRSCSTDLKTKLVMNSEFLSILYNRPLREKR